MALRVRLKKTFNRVIDVEEELPSSSDYSIIVCLGHIWGLDAK
jgi:hypothetical protein